MRIAAAFRRGKYLYLHPDSQSTEGAWIATEPFVRIDLDNCAEHEVNDAIWQVLNFSRGDVPHPTIWNLLDPLYKLAGVSSWTQFASQECRCVRIEWDDKGEVRLIPQENRNPDGGYVDCGRPLTLQQNDGDDWLSLLTDAFSRCK